MLALLTGISASPLLAQENTTSETSASTAKPVKEIIVTGSHIRRQKDASAVTVQVLSRSDVEEAGSSSLSDIIEELPAANADLSPENTATSVQNSGLSTVNLRNLGTDRTLTLIDGHRTVSNSGNGERVSLDTIPSGFVDSVEVTTGGASAIYGSDAIAGVVNIKLKHDFDGLSGNVRSTQLQRSGGAQYMGDLTWGKNFDDGRGNIMIGFNYEHDASIYADKTRKKSIRAVEWGEPDSDETSLAGCDDSGKYCFVPDLSSYTPGGRFESGYAWNTDGVWHNTITDSRRFVTSEDGYNYRPGQTLSPEFRRWTLGMQGHYDLSNAVTMTASAMYTNWYTRSKSSAQSAYSGEEYPELDSDGDLVYNSDGTLVYDKLPSISSTNPYIPDEVKAIRSGSVTWRRRFTELGPHYKVNHRNTLRTNLGFEGSAWGDWQWSFDTGYSTFHQHQQDLNGINFQKLAYALDVESDGDGGYQCSDATARADGCVPINIFGTGSISKAAANYIRYNSNLYQRRAQLTLNADLNGTLFSLPAGPVKFAGGLSFRRESQNTHGQDGNTILETTATEVPDMDAAYDVMEMYTEFDLPVIRGVSLQLAGRMAEYSTVGGIYSYNAGLNWIVSRDLTLRAQYSRSQRAPTMTEYYSPLRGNYATLTDPCSGLTAAGTGITVPSGSKASAATVAANCLAETGIQNYFAENSGDSFSYDGTVYAPNQGNDTLKAETADTYTAGFDFTPHFLPGLSVSADYYYINVKDAIGTITPQMDVNLCYTSQDYPNNRFCDAITRNSTTGQITQVINTEQNLDRYLVEGVDATLNYAWKTPGLPGRFSFKLMYTHYLKQEYDFQGISGKETEKLLGEIGYPADRFRAKLRWSYRRFLFAWTTTFRGGGVDDNEVAKTDDSYFHVGGMAYHNLYMSYKIRKNPGLTFYFGVNNVLNDLGPLIPSGLDYGNSRNIVSALNDVEGCAFYAGIRFSM